MHRIRCQASSRRTPLRAAAAAAVILVVGASTGPAPEPAPATGTVFAISTASAATAQRLSGATLFTSQLTAEQAAVTAPARYRVSVGTARRVPAASASTDSDHARTLLALRFRADAGERRLVSAHVVGYQPRATPDRYLMAAMSLACWPSSSGVAGSGATQNLERGRKTALDMRFVYVAPRSGTVSCVVRAFGSRPRPTYGGSVRNSWYAWYGSTLSAGARQPDWAATRDSGSVSRVVHRGGAVRTFPRRVQSIGGLGRARLFSDHKVTTCSSSGGSRDATTGGRELCAPYVNPIGSRVRLTVRAHQWGASGACRTRTVIDRVYRVTPEVHHRMIDASGVLRPSRAVGCERRYTVSTVLRGVGGAPFVLHAGSERTTVVS